MPRTRPSASRCAVHSIHRVYHAVVYGNLKEDTGAVETYLGRDPRDRKKMAVVPQTAAGARYAYTGWQVLERFGNFTYIACRLKTGRTHQIRVHMASLGHPLAGDAVYGPRSCIQSWAASACTPKNWGFTTRPAAPGCSLTRRCRPILRHFWTG